MEPKDTLSSCSNSEEQQMQQIQDKAKGSCMVSFRRLHLHLKLLSNNDLKGTQTESGFKRAFATLFGHDVEAFTCTMFLNVDQLESNLTKKNFKRLDPWLLLKALHKREYDSRVNERQMQTTEEKVDTSKALDASLVNTESSGTESRKQDTSSRSGNDAHADDADIKPIYNEEPIAEDN
ncbi:hypothetical protein Tco_0304037 [Tanacetum coccineum]